VDPCVLTQRLQALPGSEALLHRDDFDARNDLHLDAAAAFLLDRFHASNDSAHLALLWELTQRRLREIARSIVRQHALAADPDDLVAGFFTRLFTDVRRPQARVRRFLGLAHTAMRNDARNQLRQAARVTRRQASFQASLAPPPDPSAELAAAEQDALCARVGLFVIAVVGACFHHLRDRDRRILLLREVQGLDYERLAQEMELPANQVGSVLRRARERLATRLARALSAHEAGLAQTPAPPATTEEQP
jgi:RNA polymerase sigma factor (sigma-70 family)